MPIIRAEGDDFRELWNLHLIRKQPNRPEAVAGRPKLNYFYPPDDIECYARDIDERICNEVQNDFPDWGMCIALYDFPSFATSEVRGRC